MNRPLSLVTGAGGFLGRYVVEQLIARGDRVRAFSRGDYPELRETGAETVRGDVRIPDSLDLACRDADAVFHVAAISGIWGKWSDYYQINTLGTQNVIAACRRQGVPKLVYTSSPSVVFNGRDQEGIDEQTPYPQRWLCHYPHSKALAEQMVLKANDVDGLLTCALRPHLIWGPRDGHLIPRLIERARAGRLRQVGAGTNLIDMIYVENAARAHLLAAEALVPGSATCGRAYFISQGEPVNCWQWINRILELAGLNPVRRSIGLPAAWRLGALCEIVYSALRIQREPPMTRFLAAQLAHSHYYDIGRAREDFGYSVVVSTQDGMQRLADSLSGLARVK